MAEFESCSKCKFDGKGTHEFPCNECVHNAREHFRPKSNADRIRAMSDEELAEFLDSVFNNLFDGYEFPCEDCSARCSCNVCFRDWLKSEVKE